MSDLIRRQAAIDTEGLDEEIRCKMCRNQMKTDRGCDGNCKYDEKLYEKIMQILYERIKPLSSAQPEPQWIPCSEMEPKKSGRYLCTHSGTGIVSPDYYTTQEQAEELFADPEDEYLDLEEYIGWTSKNVIAWMPLPEPYRAERRTDEGN